MRTNVLRLCGQLAGRPAASSTNRSLACAPELAASGQEGGIEACGRDGVVHLGGVESRGRSVDPASSLTPNLATSLAREAQAGGVGPACRPSACTRTRPGADGHMRQRCCLQNKSGRCVDDQLQSRVVVGLETGVIEAQRAARRVVQCLAPGQWRADVVSFPPTRECGVNPVQLRHQLREGGIARPQIIHGAKLRQHGARGI